MKMPVRLTIAFLLMPLSATAQGPSVTVVGRWVPVDSEIVIWDFDEHGSVTQTLTALPGAYGTYRLEANRLTMVFGDQSTITSAVSIAGDRMVETAVGPSPVEQRLTRVGTSSDQTEGIVGTWRMDAAYGPSGLHMLWSYLPDGTFRGQAALGGTYSLVDDVVTVTMTMVSSPTTPSPRTLRYRLTGDGPDATLVPLDVSASVHPPTLRRAPAKP
jgi:hypothetical protein